VVYAQMGATTPGVLRPPDRIGHLAPRVWNVATTRTTRSGTYPYTPSSPTPERPLPVHPAREGIALFLT